MGHDFEDLYARAQTPWEVGKPQHAFVQHAGHITGAVLDVGCGTGDLAIWAAGLPGTSVTGVDHVAQAIDTARAKAIQANVHVDFQAVSALELATLARRFDTVLDSLVFHVFDDEDRRDYVKQLAAATRPGGRLLLLVFSDAEPQGAGPRRVRRDELEASFAQDFVSESIQPTRFEMNDPQDRFSPGGPHGWFAHLRRRR